MNSESDLAKSLAIARVALGTVALLLPKLTASLFLLNSGRNPQLPYMTRLFAAREIALGAVSLAAPEESRTQLLGVGIAVDGSDAVAGLVAARSGVVSKPAGAVLTVAALGAVAAGAAAIAGRR